MAEDVASGSECPRQAHLALHRRGEGLADALGLRHVKAHVRALAHRTRPPPALRRSKHHKADSSGINIADQKAPENVASWQRETTRAEF